MKPGPLCIGAPEGNRTPDLWYRKPTLYPLSYEGGIPTCNGRWLDCTRPLRITLLNSETDRSTGAWRGPHQPRHPTVGWGRGTGGFSPRRADT